MSHHINRHYLPVQVAERMQQEILVGTWFGQLPGRRILAKRYQVSEKTCAAAIAILGKRGILCRGGQGKSWKIKELSDIGETYLRGKNLLVLYNSLSPPSHEDEALLHLLESAWQGASGQSFRKGVDFGYYKRPESYLKTLIHSNAADVLILLTPTNPWTEAAHQLLPVFQISGQAYTAGATSFFSYSTVEEITRLTRHLADLGHQRILIPWREENVVPFILDGLEQGFDGKFSRKQLEPFCPLVSDDTPESWTRFWHSSITLLEPSAIIVFDDRHLTSLYSFCSRAGIKIPKHLSIILAAYNPLFDWLQPKLTMSIFPNNAVLQQFERWMSNGYQPCGVHFLTRERVDGDSVAVIPREENAAS